MAVQPRPQAGHSTRADICTYLNVSRETGDRLAIYAALLEKWQARINLISSRTLPDIWFRHIFDCAQLVRLLPAAPQKIMDIGTGAGLPGIILAILTDHEIHLVESDARKVSFLYTALRETGSRAIIHEGRIEHLPPQNPDIVTARALAPLDRLMRLASGQHHKQLTYLFLKGREAKQELTLWPTSPTLEADLIPSLSDNEAAIIRLRPIFSK